MRPNDHMDDLSLVMCWTADDKVALEDLGRFTAELGDGKIHTTIKRDSVFQIWPFGDAGV